MNAQWRAKVSECLNEPEVRRTPLLTYSRFALIAGGTPAVPATDLTLAPGQEPDRYGGLLKSRNTQFPSVNASEKLEMKRDFGISKAAKLFGRFIETN
jgi:hypothetical protein